MRMRLFIAAFLVLGCCYSSDAQDSLTDLAVPSFLSMPKGIKVNAFAQVGFQWLGSNMTLPQLVQSIPIGPGSLTLGEFDWELKDANFWSGTAGFSAVAGDKYSLFASIGGLLNRPFVAAGSFPFSLFGFSASSSLEFSSTNVESWFVQTGAGMGPLIGGFYWDHFAFSLSDPRNQAGPLPNQTLQGDVLAKSFCPFIGISLPSGGATATVIYSPLAYSKTTLVLRNFRNRISQTEYFWNKPGQFVSATFQYNTPVTSSISFGLWANYLWMKVRGDAEVVLTNSALAAPISGTVTVTMSKYAYGGGLSLGYNF